jgi:tRNA/tmRNA/rRNA uracil-C5-methylase (TrmA/RlmC/RlmD family)
LYKPENLEKYTRPQYYMGPNYYEYYPFLGRSRDSSILENCNFQEGLKAIGGESETVLVIRDHHWAVGWIETIYIHESNDQALQIADEITAALSDYPVISDDKLSEMEWEETCRIWEQATIKDKIYWLKQAGISFLQARKNDFGSVNDPRGILQEMILY